MSAPLPSTHDGPIMKVILKPISHPRVGDIDIVDDLFAIGRNEEPFASRLGEAAENLSRRHARVFQEGGKVFVTDLGSRNGTRVNERELKHNVAATLRNNDRITFGEAVEFRVEIHSATEQAVDKAPALRLTLVPEDPAGGLDAIAIERFPFLISRNEGEFEHYKERLPAAWRRLSRRHAVIAIRGGRVSIEDLGSSNGTFVSGARLDERARPLSNGDVIAFGDPQFSYKARIEVLHEPTQFAGTVMRRPEPAIAAEAAEPVAFADEAVVADQPEQAMPSEPSPVESRAGTNRTRFVSSADSFINVFCADDEFVGGTSESSSVARTAEVQQLRAPPTGIRKYQLMLRQVWRALGGGGSVSRRAAWGAAIVLGAIVIAAAITYLIGMDRRGIKDLLAQGQYTESAKVANRYLEHSSDDFEAGAWAEEALTKAIVPTWMKFMEQENFTAADQFLAAQRKQYPFIPRGQQMIDTLAWAGRVEAHIAERGGANSPIAMFRHEPVITALVDEWRANSFRHQQIMDQMVTREPHFEPIHTRVFSYLTSLRSDNAIYVKAIGQLRTSIEAALRRDDRGAIGKLINEFAANYPRVIGVDALRDDLARYDTLSQLIRQKELLQLVHLSRTAQFRTPVFAEHVDIWLEKQLPPAEIIAKHAEAAAAWNAGKHDEAIATLKSVKDAPWGEVAARQIDRYEKIGADYNALRAAKGTDGYYDRLLVMWSGLRPNEDEHLIRALEADFVAHREQVLPRLDRTLDRARGHWSEYQTAGGISGVIRVEERVSPRFSAQAKRLSSAYREISTGARTYQMLQMQAPPEWQTLQRDVADEVQRQRRWLQDLDIVLEPVLLHAKLDLLPEISEQSLWVQSTTDPRKD
ncbi:FHA domain-containing protein [Steroidobacter sp. S1-65]|uniref:FHA domain-containing protein n=2 Tax=Steroidobacter gossypii TaxID=2805490 RepID=A0ABS1X0T5_9GAMM|nr:FHA domain-containing protein [Steroidobacter gossypii]